MKKYSNKETSTDDWQNKVLLYIEYFADIKKTMISSVCADWKNIYNVFFTGKKLVAAQYV